MLTSMTGFGAASADENGVSCAVEIRAVNNRFFKAVIKLPDRIALLEPEIDRTLRESIIRGSIVLTIAVKDTQAAQAIAINQAVLATYIAQAKAAYHALASGPDKILEPRIDVASLFALPGVVEAGEDTTEYVSQHQGLVMRLVKEAIAKLTEMRRREGAALLADLQKHIAVIHDSLAKITEHAPQVARDYHEKLKNRVTQMVSDAKLSLNDNDLLREVALFADRADISEEINRLGGHVEQFVHVCAKEDQAGRKLDFISQEMLREANTIASKCNHSGIARLTVDIKSAIDRIKEQVQNVE